MANTFRKNRWAEVVAADLNVLPLMNLFVVLIPLLLLSAVFLEVAVIDMNQTPSDTPAPLPEEALGLTIRIAEAAYLVEANGFPPQEVARRAAPGTAGRPDRATRLRLAAALRDIATQRPENQSVQIVPRETTHYEEIITVMDVSRAAGLPIASLVGDARGAI